MATDWRGRSFHPTGTYCSQAHINTHTHTHTHSHTHPQPHPPPTHTHTPTHNHTQHARTHTHTHTHTLTHTLTHIHTPNTQLLQTTAENSVVKTGLRSYNIVPRINTFIMYL